MRNIPDNLPDWVVAGAKFKLHGRRYHVHGVVSGVAVLKEWWRTKRRWNYTAEEPVHFWAAERYIQDIRVGKKMRNALTDIMPNVYSLINDSSGCVEKNDWIAYRIGELVLSERQRCADVARRYLEDIAGCNMNEDEPEKIAAAIMDPKWEPPPL